MICYKLHFGQKFENVLAGVAILTSVGGLHLAVSTRVVLNRAFSCELNVGTNGMCCITLGLYSEVKQLSLLLQKKLVDKT